MVFNHHNHKLFYRIAFLLLSGTLSAHVDFGETKNAYLGQRAPGNVPQMFAKDLLVDFGFVFCRITFSKDGKSFITHLIGTGTIMW